MIAFNLPNSFTEHFKIPVGTQVTLDILDRMNESILPLKQYEIIVSEHRLGKLPSDVIPIFLTATTNVDEIIASPDVIGYVLVKDYLTFTFMFVDLRYMKLHILDSNEDDLELKHSCKDIVNDPKHELDSKLHIQDNTRSIHIEEDCAWFTFAPSEEIATTWWRVKNYNINGYSNVLARAVHNRISADDTSLSFRRSYVGPDVDFMNSRANKHSALEQHLKHGYTWNKIKDRVYRTVIL